MKKIKHFTKRMLAIMLAGALTMGSLPVSAFGAADIGNVASTSDVAEEVISDASDYEDVDNGNVASTSDNVEEVISDASDYEDADNGNVASTSDVAEEVNSDASDYEDADEATDSIEDKYEEMAEVESTESSEEEVLPEEVSEVEEASETGEAEEPIEDAEPIETEKGLEQEEVILPKNVEKAVPEETIVTDRQDAGSNDFTIEDGVLTEYSGNGGNVVIPEGVTSLGNNTFYDCDSLTEITIPDSVTAIGDYVFYNCDSLTKVTLGTGVAKIGTYAFAYCYKLENLRVNGDVAEYGSWVFDGTGDNIRTLEIGSGVTELNSTLYSMSGLSEILVDSGNKAYYSDKGMLYKGTVLVKCPWCKESDFEILDGTTEIGANAFYECDNLTEITIPDSVTAIGDNAFYDCDSLESISISEGTQSIGSYGFAYCEKLESIQLPDSVTSIARYAFYNDSKLTIYCSVDSFAAKYAAENKIKYITDTYCIQFKLYKNCSVVQGQAQDKVEDFIRNYTVSLYDQTTEKKLTGFMVHQNAIVLQSGTVSPGDEIIINIVSKRGETVDYETSIILDDQIRADAEFTVQQKGYVSILLRSRDKISSILVYDGNGSFCEAMESSGDQKMSRFLTSGDYQIVFIQGENYLWKFEDISLFNGNGLEEKKDFILEKVTVQDGVVSRLDSIEVPAIDTELLRYLDGSTASYTVNTNQSTSGSLLSFKIEYALKELRKDAVKNINLRINIPEGCNYVSGSLTIDGKATTQVSENSTMISVPLSATEGVIRFSARPISYGKITTTAYLYFNAENRNHTETIGMLDIDIPYITLSCQSETSSKRVHVDGLTIPKERVAIYDGFTRIGTLTSNASGKWSGEVTLATATEGSTHALRAKVYPGTEKEIESETAYVLYTPDAVTVSQFIMYYNGCNKIDLTDIMYSPKKVVSFNPSYPFTFTVKLSDNNAVETVNIVSTKGSDIRRIKAIYDEDTDQWVAKGYFDNNHSYVPGILSVEYDQKKENYTIDINAELPQTDKENLPEEIQNATGSVIRNTYNNNSSEGESIIDVTLADEDHSHVFIGTKTESIPEGKAGNYSIEKLIDDGYVEFSSPDNKKFLVNAFETTDGKFVTDYLEFTKKGNSWEATQTQTTVVSITSDLLESDEWGLARDIILNHVFDAMKDPWGGFSGPVADLIFKMGDEEKRTEQINNATNRIRSMNISQEEKQRRLEQLHNINCLRAVNFGLSLLPTVIGIGVGIFFPGAGLAFGLGSALLGYLWGINYSYLFDSQLRNLMYCDMRWAVDPSGYVYEAVPSNRLEGVTTTIYYKDAKGEEILWDASEYEQLNPIQTDADGLYAWDVPEGEWRVKYEMEGYQTKYSEWMPVPPIQTDVNIGMISEANPTIGGFEMYEDYAVLSFDKYMDVSTVTDSNITVKGQDGNFKVFIVEPVDEENVDGTKLAKVFRLRFGETLSWGVYTISVGRGVKDYAGFTLKEDYKEEGQIKKTIESFEVTVPEEIRTKQTVTIPVSILPEGDYSEYQISCSSSMEDIAKVESVSEIDSCGNANIILEAKLPGTVILTAKLEGTSFEKNVKVDILSAEEMEISPSTVDISTCDVSLEENSYSFDGNAKEPAVVVMNGDITLERDVDYTVSYSNNISVGTATMIITGEGNCTGTITKTFKITKASQSITVKSTASSIAVDKTATVSITGNKGTKSYKSSNTAVATVDPKTGKVTAKKVGTVKITATSSATSNYNAASKTVTIKVVKGTQSITAKTSVSPIAVGKTATVSITGNKGTKSFKSSNTAIATVTSAGKVTAKKVGTVTITATSAATSNYNTASKTVTIKVVPAATSSVTAANQATGIKLTWKKVAGATGYKVYRGSTLLKTIKSGSTVVCTDTKANTNGTKYTFKIVPTASTGNGTSKSLTTYRVARPAVKTVKNSASKKMTVTWGKNAKGTGYQIQYSTDKSFKSGNKTATVTKTSTVSKVIGSLTKGKTYYVRIRTYKTVGSKKYWSAWSATKSVKISK